MTDSLPADDLPVGAVRRAGPWTVAHRRDGELRATQLIKAYGVVAVLRRRRSVRDGDRIVVQE
jgi:hypothetical protein